MGSGFVFSALDPASRGHVRSPGRVPELRDSNACGESACMLVLTLQTEMPLAEPNEEFGFVTWLDVSVRQFDAPTRESIGRARIALIQVADAMNRGAEIREVLAAAGDELFALHDVFFDDDEYLKPDYANGIGFNVMYFAEVELVSTWRGRRIEEALVRRVADTWGEGCAIAVVPVNDEEIERWLDIGFKSPDSASTFAYLDLSLAHPKMIALDDPGHAFAIQGDR
jgi:hypothetical protein